MEPALLSLGFPLGPRAVSSEGPRPHRRHRPPRQAYAARHRVSAAMARRGGGGGSRSVAAPPTPSRSVLTAHTARPLQRGPTGLHAPPPVLAARPGRPVGVPHPRPALSRQAAAFSGNRVCGCARSSPSHRRHPPSRAATRTLTVPTGYLTSLPQTRGGGEWAAKCLHLSPPWCLPAPLGDYVQLLGYGSEGGRRGPLPQSAPRRRCCRRHRPGRCLERVCGASVGAGKKTRRGGRDRPLHR